MPKTSSLTATNPSCGISLVAFRSAKGCLYSFQINVRQICRGALIATTLATLLCSTPAPAQQAEPRRIPESLNFANGLFRERRYELAAEEYEKFLETARPGPFANEARFGLGSARLFLSQYPKARTQFEEFLKAAPDHPNAPTAWYRIGEAAYVLGDLPAARKALETYTSRYPKHRFNDSAWPYLGDVCFRLGDLPRAREAYEKALADYPKERLAPRAKLGLGRTLAAQGKYEDAVKTLTDLAEHGGADWADKAWFQVGQAQLAAGRPAEAVAAFQTLENDAPKSPLVSEARLRRAEALIRLDKNNDAEPVLRELIAAGAQNLSAQAAFVLGSAQLKSGKDVDAFATLDDAFQRFSNAPIAPALLFRSAEAKLKQGDNAEARTRFLKVAELHPNDPWADDALLQAARIALEARDANEVARIVAQFTERFPKSPLIDDAKRLSADAQFLVAQGLIEKKEYDKAVPLLAAYLATNPNGNVADYALAYLAQAKLEQGHADEAKTLVDELANKFPKSKALAPARLRLAGAALTAKQYDSAAEQFRLAAESGDPAARGKAQLDLGWALLDGGKPAEAAAAFGALLEKSPDDPLAPDAAVARGRALELAKQPDQALAAYALAAEKYPKSDQAATALLARAHLLVDLKKPAEAAAAFERYIKDHPEPAQKPGSATLDALLAEWGWALVDAEKPADADKVFTRLLNDFPDSPHAADARFNLAESANKIGKADEVIKLLTPLVAEGTKAPPDLVEPALYRLGRTLTERKDWSAAAKSLDRFLNEFPKSRYRREARFLRAEAALWSDDPKSAEEAFAALAAEPAAASDPPGFLAAIRRLRIQSLLAMKRWTDVIEAADAFKKEFADDPLIGEIDYAKGRALQSLAKFDEARAAYQSVIDARRAGDLSARAQLMRGETYFHQKAYRKALPEFLKVDILYDAPQWQAAALLEAGKVYEELAQWADAAETYERLCSKFPDDPNTKQAKSKLELVRKRAEGTPSVPETANSAREK